ncbi:MAG TPA: acyloxyacyl hydrolase [Rhodocyclaceae bacterium]|nr:acyloxyacyl hydrolase [Rhodocyclaceae bacterium]
MKRQTIAAALAATVITQPGPAAADDFSVGIGRGSESTDVLRLGAQRDFGGRLQPRPEGGLSAYWELAYTYWRGDGRADNHSLSLAPVFVYEFSSGRARPYVEAAIGIAFFDRTRIGNENLGSSFQFEDRLGFGVRFGRHDLAVKLIHYSNAGIKGPNDGAETYLLQWRSRF